MPRVLKKLLSFRGLFKRRKSGPDEIIEEKWIADFSRQKNNRFLIKSESSFDAKIQKNLFYSGHSLVLALKKSGCAAWVEAPERRYRDLAVSGAIRIDARGGYGAGGMLFRMVDSGTYYSFLISSMGYFRLDVVRNGMPFPLVGWTELPLSSGAVLGPDQAVDFSLIVYGSHIVILVQGRWAAEVDDSSMQEGTVCFAAASYESGDPAYEVFKRADKAAADQKSIEESFFYVSEAFLDSLTVDSRIVDVASLYEKWRDSPEIDSNARLRLAETFTAMDQFYAAMAQLRKCWDSSGHRKTQRELLLAGRLAQALDLMGEAEDYISQCFQADVDSAEGKEAVTEMAKILYSGERFVELKDYCTEAVKIKDSDPLLWTFLGHGCWNLKENKNAAAAYDRAFELDPQNGIFAKNAANVYDVMGRKKEALKRYLEAGRAFLKNGNYNDLGLLVPRLLSLGEDNWEARSLAGKWAFSVEDWKMAEEEFQNAEELRKNKRPKPPKDGAMVFLEALLLIRNGKRTDALPLLVEAASVEKDFALFHFRLAENLYLLDENPEDPVMLKELNTALALIEDDSADNDAAPGEKIEGLPGWINNFAAQIALKRGNPDAAARYLEKAAKTLGDLPEVRVNQAILFYQHSSLEKALELLDGDRQDDPEGIMANCAGNLLVRSECFEEADERYRRALEAAPQNVEYLCNRSSCLMELGLYGEADDLLTKAHSLAPSPELLEMISYAAVKKGEYPRAEEACRSALEMDPEHGPSLLSLGWMLLNQGRYEETYEIIQRLDKLKLKDKAANSREELQTRLDKLYFDTVECASCVRTWKVVKDLPVAPALRLMATPPDHLPAGSCPECGKTYCIGCAKKHLAPSGRFTCPHCSKPLKLANEGLKKILRDWSAAEKQMEKKKIAPKALPEVVITPSSIEDTSPKVEENPPKGDESPPKGGEDPPKDGEVKEVKKRRRNSSRQQKS